MRPESLGRRGAVISLVVILLLPLVPAGRQSGGGRSSTSDSLFAGTPPVDSLRPARRVSTPKGPGLPLATTAALGFALAIGLSLTRDRFSSGRGRGDRDAVDAALTRLRRIQDESHLDEEAFCARLTSVLRSYLDDVGEEGWPPGRPVQSAVRRQEPLHQELKRWESVRFGGRELDPEERKRAAERLAEWLKDDRVDRPPVCFRS